MVCPPALRIRALLRVDALCVSSNDCCLGSDTQERTIHEAFVFISNKSCLEKRTVALIPRQKNSPRDPRSNSMKLHLGNQTVAVIPFYDASHLLWIGSRLALRSVLHVLLLRFRVVLSRCVAGATRAALPLG